jgi:hypothetical protein
MRLLFVTILTLVLTGCGPYDKTHVKERVDFWKSELETNIPAGTSKEKAREWGGSRNVKFSYLPSQNWLYSTVEKIPGNGIGFPCDGGQINLIVVLDANNRSVKNEVKVATYCI